MIAVESVWPQWETTWTLQSSQTQLEMIGSKVFLVLMALGKLKPMLLELSPAQKESLRKLCLTRCYHQLVKSLITT